MAYLFRRKKTVKRIVDIAKKLIDKAIEEIDDEELDRHEVVHQVRKRCKKLRGLIRLIRPAFPDYMVHRKTADDLADLLGDDHDLAVLKETLEKESQRFDDDGDLERIFTLIDERRTGLQHQTQLLGVRP